MKTKRILEILVISVILVAAGGALAFWWLTQPLGNQDKSVSFVITRGQSIRSIGEKLEQEKVIRSKWAFQWAVWRQKLTQKVQAGTFTLTPTMSVYEVARALTQGTNDVWITVKEGKRATEIGEELAAALPNFEPTGEVFQTECEAFEGYLFPETYLVPKLYDTRQTCRLLRQQYGEKVTMKIREDMHAAGKKEEEVMVLASIIEREARKPEDMKVVAGILWNRIELGMPLQVDATLQYIKGYDEKTKTWWTPPTAADKELDSPYNTYKNAGLPPKPISNPGIQAILAATYPTKNEYLYYISSSDGSSMHYAKTYDEHKVNIEKYLR